MFSCVFCLMFLIDAIKPNRKEIQNFFIFHATVLGRWVGSVWNKTIFLRFVYWQQQKHYSKETREEKKLWYFRGPDLRLGPEVCSQDCYLLLDGVSKQESSPQKCQVGVVNNFKVVLKEEE